MVSIKPVTSTVIIPSGTGDVSQIKKYTGFAGRFLHFFGAAIKSKDEKTGKEFYVKLSDVSKVLLGDTAQKQLSKKGKTLVNQRILEITDPDSRKPLSINKLRDLFAKFNADKNAIPNQLNNEKAIVNELEKIKLDMSEMPQLFFDKSLEEIADQLKPGDFIGRKWHEDNANIIPSTQKFFYQSGWREAYKFSHIAVYLGKDLEGKHWVAEATMPHGNESQIRRIRLDDPRLNLKEKNQYFIVRNKNPELAEECARLTRRYVVKLLPENEKPATVADKIGSLQYNLFEAIRSMYRSSKLKFYGTHRLLKYYADYKNKIPFEYLGKTRGLFCSHFAIIMESIAEMNKSPKFQEFLKKHPIPKMYDETKKGLALKMAKFGYSIRKGIWSRQMAYMYGKEIRNSVTTHLDALRTSPQSTINYMLNHKDQFQVIGLVNHRGDYDKVSA